MGGGGDSSGAGGWLIWGFGGVVPPLNQPSHEAARDTMRSDPRMVLFWPPREGEGRRSNLPCPIDNTTQEIRRSEKNWSILSRLHVRKIDT